jgi:hypothetical protein
LVVVSRVYPRSLGPVPVSSQARFTKLWIASDARLARLLLKGMIKGTRR